VHTLAQLARRVRQPAAVTAGLVAAGWLAGCGSVPAPGTAQPPRAHHTTRPATVQPARAHHAARPGTAASACREPELRVTLDTAAAGVAAGSSYVPLEFTNASAQPCTLTGYPTVEFASGAAGAAIGAPAVAQGGASAGTTTLAPGGDAHAWLQILDVANYSAQQCKPVTAGGLRISFGATATSTYLAHAFATCANEVQGGNILAVYAVQAGLAVRGTAP
jgi:hypothetical protein